MFDLGDALAVVHAGAGQVLQRNGDTSGWGNRRLLQVVHRCGDDGVNKLVVQGSD